MINTTKSYQTTDFAHSKMLKSIYGLEEENLKLSVIV